MYFPSLSVLAVVSFGLVIGGVLFTLLSLLFPGIKGKPVVRSGMLLDTLYWYMSYVLYAPITQWLIGGLVYLLGARLMLSHSATASVFSHFDLSMLPLIAQLFIILLLTDLVQYVLHRFFHGRFLWKFHAIHHSSEEVDWLSAVRFHPLNLITYSVVTGTLVALFSFDPLVYIMLVPFNMFYSSFTHANLSFTFGPLRYLFASPVFHRWHHTRPKEGGERNFAPTFPFIDILFGTFYMPKGMTPEHFGTTDPVPKTLLGQLIYPFRP